MPIFQINDKIIKPVKSKNFKIEKDLQTLI
jgi:hypothetical protein